ncbi:MAG: SMI1/KNR4 family protein, partial [Candidatus Sericytochromatia bacterium]
MALIFTEQTNKVSLDEIINFESKVKILLPKDYKDFLLKYNGGVLENNEYKIYLPPEKNKKRGKNLYFSIWSLERLDSLLELFEDKILIIDNRMLSIGDLDGGGIYISVSG